MIKLYLQRIPTDLPEITPKTYLFILHLAKPLLLQRDVAPNVC
jgi:hypothetical protein